MLVLISSVSADIKNVDCEGDNLKCYKYSFSGNLLRMTYENNWLHFKGTTDSPYQELVIKFDYIAKNTYLYNQVSPTLKYSCDAWNWLEVPVIDKQVSFVPKCENMRIAVFYPVTYDWMNNWVKKWSNSDYISLAKYKSYQGRQFNAITISNNDGKEKKNVVMVFRQHTNEIYSEYVMFGFIDSFYNNKSFDLLEKYNFLIFPMANPDGVYTSSGLNAQKLDLNDHWDDNDCYEVNLIKSIVKDKFNHVDYYFDWHGDAGYNVKTESWVYGDKYSDNKEILSLLNLNTILTKTVLSYPSPEKSRYYFTKTYGAISVSPEIIQTDYSTKELRKNGEYLVEVFRRMAQ